MNMKYNTLKSARDEEIVAKIISEAHADYFEILYNRYHTKVLDKCYSLLKNHQLAKDFTEDIFSKTYEKLKTFRNISSFSSWLYSITYNHCIDYLRHKKKLHYPEWNRENEIPEIMDETEDHLKAINYDDLLVVLDMIHPEEKALLVMKYQDNISLKHISESLRISEDATKMRLKRARTRVLYLYKEKFLNK
jgi:RNA polymerase sigma factor (sigma-70 family)